MSQNNGIGMDKPTLDFKLIQNMKNGEMLEELNKLSLRSNNELDRPVIWEHPNFKKALNHLKAYD